MRVIKHLALLVIASAVIGACGGESGRSPEAPEDALRRHLQFISDDEYGREWDELHPAQQELVSREQFEACAADTPAADIDLIEVLQVYDDPINIPGVPETTSKAITVEVRIGDATEEHTFHEILVDGKWRWTLPISALSTYHDGNCPA